MAGVVPDRLVEAHGSFDTASCIRCATKHDPKEVKVCRESLSSRYLSAFIYKGIHHPKRRGVTWLCCMVLMLACLLIRCHSPCVFVFLRSCKFELND